MPADVVKMKATYIVHGFVQGVGYRWFVKRIADSLGIKGTVRNEDDGSVSIIAYAQKKALSEFEERINVSQEHGIQVHNIDKIYEEDDAQKDESEKFRIAK